MENVIEMKNSNDNYDICIPLYLVEKARYYLGDKIDKIYIPAEAIEYTYSIDDFDCCDLDDEDRGILKDLLSKVKNGDADVQQELGSIYFLRRVDVKKAFALYTMSANQGYGIAQRSLSDLYHLGEVVTEEDSGSGFHELFWAMKAVESDPYDRVSAIVLEAAIFCYQFRSGLL
jgi:TPR repeat protein